MKWKYEKEEEKISNIIWWRPKQGIKMNTMKLNFVYKPEEYSEILSLCSSIEMGSIHIQYNGYSDDYAAKTGNRNRIL